jgi:hypothetical protein
VDADARRSRCRQRRRTQGIDGGGAGASPGWVVGPCRDVKQRTKPVNAEPGDAGFWTPSRTACNASCYFGACECANRRAAAPHSRGLHARKILLPGFQPIPKTVPGLGADRHVIPVRAMPALGGRRLCGHRSGAGPTPPDSTTICRIGKWKRSVGPTDGSDSELAQIDSVLVASYGTLSRTVSARSQEIC